MTGRKENLRPMWKKRMELVDLGRTDIIFLTMRALEALNVNANRTKVFLRKNRKMFQSRISAGAIVNLHGWDKSHAKTIAWSHDMEFHAKK